MSGIIELKVKNASFVLDPDDFDPTQVTRTPVAKPTEGPHRYTIYVPHDEAARISVGKAHPIKGEDGIALETKTHIHLWTHDKDECGVGSYLHLGKRSGNTGYDTNKQGDGYGLYTSGSSSHVALKNVSLISQEDSIFVGAHGNIEVTSKEANVTINATEAIMGRASGNIELCAGKEEEIEFSSWDKVLGVGLVAFETFEFFAPLAKFGGEHAETAAEGGEAVSKGFNLYSGMVDSNAGKWKEKFIATHAKTAAKVLKHAEAMSAVILGFKKTMKKTKKEESGWVEDATAWISYGVEAVTKLLAAAEYFAPEPYEYVVSQLPGYSKAEKKCEEGKIKLRATEGITLDTDKNVSVYAADTVSLAGFMGNSITGLGCTVKAYKDVSIWGGMGAAMKSLAGDVAMTTDFGEANVKGHGGVEVSSAEGSVKVTGEKNVQVNSVKAKLQAHGKEGAYFGAGTGDGQGFIATKTKLEIGCITAADKFKDVKLDKDHGTITITKIMAAMGNGPDNRLDIKKAGAQLKAAKLDVKTSGPIKINGATVNIN